jgi:DNA modification methylase
MQHQLAYERVNIASLKFDPRNARKHDDRNIKAIMDSLSKFGQQKAIVVGEDNIVIAGNGTLEAAKRLGWDTIDVRRSGLKSDEATAYAIADNRSAELAEWDDPVLGDILSELKESGWELDDLGFNDEDLEKYIKQEGTEGLTDEDDVPDVAQNEFGVKRGDIWQLGNHRLMCGDSTLSDDVVALMNGEKADMVFTDPPYGVSVNNTQGEILGDQDLEVFKNCLPRLVDASKQNAHFYVWCASGDRLPESIWSFSQIIKFQNMLPVRVTHENKRGPKAAFKHNYESCLFGNDNTKKFNKSNKFKVSETTLNDERYKGDGRLSVYPALWDGTRATEHNMNIVHPTQKKVEMIEFYLEISSNNNDLCLDLFLGSGSTLIACEKTGRKCYGMELDEHYCSVIIKRWQDFTGKKAERIVEGA